MTHSATITIKTYNIYTFQMDNNCSTFTGVLAVKMFGVAVNMRVGNTEVVDMHIAAAHKEVVAADSPLDENESTKV